MSKLNVLWVPIPRGMSRNTLHLGLFATLRVELDAGTTLAALFPSDSVYKDAIDKALELTKPKLSFTASKRDRLLQVDLPAPSGQIDFQLWKRLFPLTTLLQSSEEVAEKFRKAPLGEQNRLTYSTLALAEHLTDCRGRMIRKGAEHPNRRLTRKDAQDILKKLRTPDVFKNAQQSRILDMIKNRLSNPNEKPQTEEIEREIDCILADPVRSAFWKAKLFHGGRHSVPAVPRAPSLELHERLAVLGAHPTLLRSLGLLREVDVELPPETELSFFKLKPPLGSGMAVRPVFIHLMQGNANASALQQRLRLACLVGAKQFAALPVAIYEEMTKDSSQKWIKEEEYQQLIASRGEAALLKGYLPFSDKNRYRAVDLDAGNSARQMGWLIDEAERAPGDDWIPPAEIGTGLAVIENKRAEHFAKRAKSLDEAVERLYGNEGEVVDLFEDHIRQGVRIDVKDSGKDETWRSLCRRSVSYFKPDTQEMIVPNADDEGVLGEHVPRRPTAPNADDLLIHEELFRWTGWSLVAPRVETPVPGVDRPKLASAPELPQIDVAITPAVGSLQRLRFGHSYSFRARVAYLGGYGVPHTDPNEEYATVPIRYLRHEPVCPPFVLDRPSNAHAPANPPTRLIVKEGCSSDSRVLVPPPGSPAQVELHGKFDGVWDAGDAETIKRAAWETLTKRNPSPPALPADGQPVDLSKYLSDPMAAGMSIWSETLPSSQPEQKPVWTGCFFTKPGWPMVRALKLTLLGDQQIGPTPPWLENKEGDEVRCPLPPGRMRRLRVTSKLLDEDTPELFKDRHILGDLNNLGLPPNSRPGLTDIANGWLEAITPGVEISLVHAVSKPRRQPAPKAHDPFQVKRNQDQPQIAELEGEWTLDVGSTGQVDVSASWSVRVDKETGDTPAYESGSGPVFSQTLDYSEQTAAKLSGKHVLPDARRYSARYTVTALTRFADCYGKGETSPSVSQPSEPITIPSAAPPPPPKVQLVVPVFDWTPYTTKTSGSETIGKIVRKGNKLRVLLERPWFASGEGELLGVLVSTTDSVSEAQRPYLSAWGADPRHRIPGLPTTTLQAEHLPPTTENHVVVHPQTQERVRVLGYPVTFDKERKLWYCDIAIDTRSAYRPFVSLALVRFQPQSVNGAHISEVVRTDFIQLEPSRTVRTRSKPAQPGQLEITLEAEGEAIRSGMSVTVCLETRRSPNAGDFGWRQTELTVNNGALCPGENIVWKGTLKDILQNLKPPAERRIAVYEYEVLDTDARSDISTGEPAKRLVFAAHIPLC